MEPLILLARIAGERVALPVDRVESVVEIDAIAPVPLTAPHVAGLAALRSRVLTVIDSYAALGVSATPRDGAHEAVVMTIDGHLYGVLVDEVEDVVPHTAQPAPPPSGLAPGWQAAAAGLVEHDGRTVLMLDPITLVLGVTADADGVNAALTAAPYGRPNQRNGVHT